MRVATIGDTVTLHFVCTDEDGKVCLRLLQHVCPVRQLFLGLVQLTTIAAVTVVHAGVHIL